MTRLRRLLACLLLLAAAPAGAMDFDALARLVDERAVRSIDDLLPLLPSTLRAHYALMFRSRSLHGASFEHPRAILYEPDGRFIVTFNGAPDQAGYDALETMAFDGATDSFSYREIRFPPASEPGGKVAISAANPERCLKCHGVPARPVWDTLPAWPGAYGERYRAGLSDAEAAGLQRFLRAQPTHPRYRHLLGVERFAERETFHPGSRARYDGTEVVPPNAELAALLGRLNFDSIVHELRQQPGFGAYRYVLLAALDGGCGRLDDFYPAAQRARVAAAYEAFARASAQANAAQQRAKQLRLLDAARGAPPGYGDPDALDAFRFVVEEGLQVSTAGWTLALEKATYDFAMSPTASAERKARFLRELARDDPGIADRMADRSFDHGDRFCSALARESRAALGAAPPGPPRAAVAATGDHAAAGPALLARCVACHDQGGGSVGPALPFGRPEELAVWLGSRATAHGTLLDEIRFRLSPAAGAGRMPLGYNPSDAERGALQAYFESLAR